MDSQVEGQRWLGAGASLGFFGFALGGCGSVCFVQTTHYGLLLGDAVQHTPPPVVYCSRSQAARGTTPSSTSSSPESVHRASPPCVRHAPAIGYWPPSPTLSPALIGDAPFTALSSLDSCCGFRCNIPLLMATANSLHRSGLP